MLIIKLIKEVGKEIFVSYRTSEKLGSNIINKLGLYHHPNSLLIWAKENQDSFLQIYVMSRIVWYLFI